ncbi:MAG: efflux RND transporter periplasmic adaptor subunit [Deltaproteobacteria bacterium]|nr:efflux RND transporter periplasmic adaptor subunit [Deltaproteobacteria bacterium]
MFRQENLSRKSVVAASELEAAENRLRQAEARLGVAESQLASARNQLADAELKLSYTRVTAAWPAAEAAGASSSSSSASSATSASASLSSPASPPSLSSPSYPAVPGSSYPSVQPQATGPASASEADGVPTAETIEEGLLASAASIGEAGREAFAAVQGESEEGDSSDGTSGSSGLALQAPSAGSPDSADTPSASSPTSSASSSTSSAFSPTPSASSSSSSPSTSSTSTSSPSTSSTPPPTYSVASSYPGPGSGTAPASGAAAPATGSEAHAGYRYVGARLADTGSQIAANTPILDIVSLDPLLVVVDVIEKDYPRITVGMEASVRAEAFPGETFSATVKRVAPVLNAASRQARVELEVPNPGLKLKPGMYAEAVFTFNRHEGVWSVAADVPYRKFDGYVIFIANPVTGKVEERRVELGIHEGDRVELLGSGPIEGPVVTMGQHLLKDGQAYRVPGAELPVPASGVSSPSGSNGQRGGIAS